MNRCTLLIDSNWLSISRMFVLKRGFLKSNTATQKEAAAENFADMMARSISIVLNTFSCIDNVVVVTDGGSWRKQLPIPDCLKDITYKGNRGVSDEQIDWDFIWSTFEDFNNVLRERGITVSQALDIEGDDWAWYWSRRLNENGTSVLIWSGDCDLKQLVCTKNRSVTAWYNSKMIVLPEECRPSDNIEDYFFNPPVNSDIIEEFRAHTNKIEYINPELIAVNKILCGDSGDNIKSIARFEKNGRMYRFSDKDYARVCKQFNIDSVASLKKVRDKIVNYICTSKKFKSHNIPASDITEMIDYNTSLVYLNESIIPQTIVESMAAQEYKVFDVSTIKRNYKILLKPNNDIQNIFDEIFSGT